MKMTDETNRDMMSLLRARAKGQTMILIGLLVGFGVLVGFVALAVDGGSALLQRRNMQNGADGAALGVAKTLANNVVQNGTDWIYSVTNAQATANVDQLLEGNRGGVLTPPHYNAELDYGTFFTGTSGYTWRTAASYSAGAWHYDPAYPATSLVPATGATSVDAVRVTAGIDNPTIFARLLGINT